MSLNKVTIHVKLEDELSIIVHPEKQSQFDEDYKVSSDNQHLGIYEMEEVKSESLDDEPHEDDVDENL